jgi:polysaccharide export outer membrane protein/exopolysaccharide production protein ExoF
VPRIRDVVSIIPRLACIGALLAFGMIAGPRAAPADDAAPGEYLPGEYHLGIGDRLHIRTFTRDDLSGDFEVRPPGNISFPLIGVVEVLGLTPSELERKIGDQLRTGYQIASSVNVEISLYRPFYIMGDVLNPGKYPFAPGIDVLQAVALAGGYYAVHPSEAQVDAIHAEESYGVYTIQQRTALIRRARLLAEQNGQPDFTVPDELAAVRDQPDVMAAMATERQLFTARKDHLATEISMRQAQVASYNEEINALNAAVASSNEQERLVNQELQDAQNLLQKGLTQRPRVLELQRVLAELRGEEAQSRAFLARARQNIGKIQEEIAEHQAQFKEDVVQQLTDTEAQLRELAQHRQSSRDLVMATQRRIPLAQGPLSFDERTKFRIRRSTADGMTEIEASETTPVQPGDVVVIPALMADIPAPGQAALVEPQSAVSKQQP